MDHSTPSAGAADAPPSAAQSSRTGCLKLTLLLLGAFALLFGVIALVGLIQRP